MAATRRYWGLDRTMMEAVSDQEKAREGLLEGLGATPQMLQNAKSIMHITGHDRPPDQQATGRQAAGVTATGYAKGEQLIVTETVINAHGDRVTEAYRKNGPHYERVRIREQQVGEHTRAVTEFFGR